MKEFELEPGEHVVETVRKHWFLFLADLLPFAILAILPLVIPAALRTAGPLQTLAASFNFSLPLARVALALWWLLVWSAAFNSFTRYFLNAWILTNQRVVEIKQYGFFNREVSSLFLNRVEDVTTDTIGILVSLLDIGDINVQTAGTIERFTMRGIPHPAMLRDLILKYASAHEDTKLLRRSGT
ncbi:PH domain-containing protein [Candidatus Kaiserbacteria bacterium]|nr:PH domain-containing protein [Candidatus Kaiserbacteria bacterium]